MSRFGCKHLLAKILVKPYSIHNCHLISQCFNHRKVIFVIRKHPDNIATKTKYRYGAGVICISFVMMNTDDIDMGEYIVPAQLVVFHTITYKDVIRTQCYVESGLLVRCNVWPIKTRLIHPDFTSLAEMIAYHNTLKLWICFYRKIQWLDTVCHTCWFIANQPI